MRSNRYLPADRQRLPAGAIVRSKRTTARFLGRLASPSGGNVARFRGAVWGSQRGGFQFRDLLVAAAKESVWTSTRHVEIDDRMPLELTKQEAEEALHSLRKYFSSEMESDLGELRAKLLLDFMVKDIAPLAYNRGVRDAENFFRRQLEDVSASCFEPPFTYWQTKKKS